MKALRFTRPLSLRGQVVVPKDIRLYLGLEEGTQVVFEVQDGVVSLHAPEAPASLVGAFLNGARLGGPSDAAHLKRVILEQYDDDVS